MIIKNMIFAIVLAATIVASAADAMSNFPMSPIMTQEEWDNYIENGGSVHQTYRPWVDLVKIDLHIKIVEKTNELNEIINDPSSVESARHLESLPSSEINTRYRNYKKVFDSFFSLLIIKQYRSTLLQKYTQEERCSLFYQAHSTYFSPEYLSTLDQGMASASTWLDAIRNSGEEFYLGIHNLAITNPPTTTPACFWRSTMEQDVLFNLKKHYYDESTHLDTSSMAILRHQLRKGFETNENADR